MNSSQGVTDGWLSTQNMTLALTAGVAVQCSCTCSGAFTVNSECNCYVL